MNPLVSLLSMAFVLSFAAVLDRFTEFLRGEAAGSFSMGTLVWGSLLANLLFAASAVALVWLALYTPGRRGWVSAVYILFGLLFLLFFPLLVSGPPALQELLSSPVLVQLLGFLHATGLQSYLMIASALVLVTGLLSLAWRPKAPASGA